MAAWRPKAKSMGPRGFSSGTSHLQGIFSGQRCERSAGNSGDDGAKDLVFGEDADHAVETRMRSSLHPGMSPPLMCCGRGPDGPPAESRANESKASCTNEIRWRCGKRDPGHREKLYPGPVLLAWGWVAVVHVVGSASSEASIYVSASQSLQWRAPHISS